MNSRILAVPFAVLLASCPVRGGSVGSNNAAEAAPSPSAGVAAETLAEARAELLTKHGEAERDRIEHGVEQVASLWRASDGDLVAFCVDQFVVEPSARDALFVRLASAFEQIDGHSVELDRTMRWGADVETGPMMPVDSLLAAYDTSAHVIDDLFTVKVAFAALLNFPSTTLSDRLRDGASYSRRTWAEVRLTGRFDTRVPGELAQAANAAQADAEQYISGYDLWMHHVLGEDGTRRFPSNKRLISHWNLRDELVANYADADGLAKQRTITRVMDRIVTQSIPRAVIDNPKLDWDPFTNAVIAAPTDEVEADPPSDRATTPTDEREPDVRFDHVLAQFRAARAIDPFSPNAPTLIDRAFDGAELPEDRVRAMLVEILSSPMADAVGAVIEARLGRKLEPHDLWYDFTAGATAEAELDAETRRRYPTAEAFAADLPRILIDLGFTPQRAGYLADHIVVDPSRGAGHAMGAGRRGDEAHLRTRVEPGGMDYKGYNIAIHELGHNVEQTFSLYDIDEPLLEGVPNNAFTEALAFLFQARDRELLGQPSSSEEADRLAVLDAFWDAREIAGSALVEIEVWHWLYDHPDASAAELREATVTIARDVWDRYFAPTLGGQDVTLLGIYSHTISLPLYLFNYVVGQVIAFQVEQHLGGLGKDPATFATEFERVSRIGSVLPDVWMQQATGKPVTPQPLLDATSRALAR